MPKEYRMIAFDCDDTLYDQTQPFRAAYDTLFGARNYDIDVEQLFKYSRKYSDIAFKDSQLGKMSMEKMYIFRIQKAFEEYGIQITDEESLTFQYTYQANQRRIFCTDTVKNMLEELKDRVDLAILTNGPSEHQWFKMYDLGLDKYIRKENIFVSGDTPYDKPEKEIFEFMLEKTGHTADETLFVGDSYKSDVLGGKNAGMDTLWMNRRHIQPTETYAGEYQVYTEEEMAELLLKLTKGS